MCGDGGASARAAAAAQAEAERQAAAERDRLAGEAAATKAESDKRYADEQTRWQAQLDAQKADAEALRKQIQDQNAATLKAQQDIETQRKAERDAEIARQAQEQKTAEEKAARDAATLRKYSTDRQGLIDNARTSVNSAFDGYNDGYFTTYAKNFVDYYKPQIDQDYEDARRKTTFGYADRGTIDSTAAERQFGRLADTRNRAEIDLSNRASSAANEFRSSVDAQRQNALSGIFGAASVAPPITADNVGEANSSLTALSSALSSPVSLASGAAGSVSMPSYTAMANPFSVPFGATAPRTATSYGSYTPYNAAKGSSGRLVA